MPFHEFGRVDLDPVELNPGPKAQTDSEIAGWLFLAIL
jgi:hypothetical protein